MNCRRIALTMGEPASIGPDICIQLIQKAHPTEIVIIGDPNCLMSRAHQLNLAFEFKEYSSNNRAQPQQPGQATLLPVQFSSEVIAGTLNKNHSSTVMEIVKTAVDGCMTGEFSALVTGPIQKSIMNAAGIQFTGHTEYLADLSQTAHPVMMLLNESLKVALVTTHIPLNEVSRAITRKRLEKVIRVLHKNLQKYFAIDNPNILVCGLNPHAGEDGHMGYEEIEIITPVLNMLRKEKIRLTGPLPADTAFTAKNLQHCDVVLAMYHDQGLPVLKHAGFGKSVNVTLGLPFIRTSVDHGTALALAGTGQADFTSLDRALSTALDMVECCDGLTSQLPKLN